MKKLSLLLFLAVFAISVPERSDAQILDAINQAICDAIMAIDLGVQQVQNQTIVLQDVQKQAENIMSQLDLNDIASWVGQEKDLFSEYYNELWQIKTALSTYQRVKDIIRKQEQIISDYNTAYNALKQDPHFSASELAHIYNVYSGILDQSVKNIASLTTVITSFVTEMSDGARLKIINGVGDKVDQNYSDLHRFTQANIQLSVERSHDAADAAAVMALYGIQQ